MISKKRFRELLGPEAKKLSDKQVNVVRDGFYSLGHMLLQWDKQHAEVSSEKIPTKGGENKCL